MAEDTLTTLQKGMKRNYSPKLAKSILLNNNMFRLFTDVSKSLRMGGQDWALYEPIKYRHAYGTAGGAEGGDFGSPDSEGIDQWQLGVARINSTAAVTGDLIDNIRKAPSLSYFEDILAYKMDTVKDAASVVLGYQIFGKGDGALCQVDTGQGAINTSGDDYFYVDNPGPEWLQEGMLIQAYDNNTTGGTKQLTANTSAFQRINRLVYDQATGKTKVYIDDVTGLANNDYIYQKGHYGVTPMTGLLGMVDDGTNMATFQGVTRATAANNWANAHVFNANSQPLNETLIFGVFEELVRRSPTKKITHIITDPQSFSWLAISLLDRQRFAGTNLTGGFQKIEYETTFGKIEISADPLCPTGYIFFLDANELGLGWGTKQGGQWWDEDGEPLKPMPSSTSDAGYKDQWVMVWRIIVQAMLSTPKSCAVLYGYTTP